MFLKHLLRIAVISKQLPRRHYYSSRISCLFLNNFDKYFAKLKTEENSHLNQRISNLLDEFTQLSGSIKDVEKELSNDNQNDNENDNELLTMMKDEKVELETKQKDSIARILNEIHEYELSKDTERIEDASSILFEISAGVGGKEAMLFANELCTMYLNYVNHKNWDIMDVESADEQGGYMRHFKAKIEGRNVWNYMKYEAGVHRVQRIPETEARGRVHTSTVSVACIPITNDCAVEIIGESKTV